MTSKRSLISYVPSRLPIGYRREKASNKIAAGSTPENADFNGSSQPGRRGRSLLGPFVLLVGIIGPVAGLVAVVAFAPDSLPSVDPPAATVNMPVQLTPDSKAQAVQASLNWRTGPSLRAPNWSGLVTAVNISRGKRITSGTPIVTINGIERIALASPQPFFRQIGPGITGSDVEALRTALSRLEMGPAGSGATYDADLQSAIKRLDAKLSGISAAKASGVFDPSWVIYLPSTSVTAASVDLQLGTTPPAPGQLIVTSPRALKPFRLSASTSQGVPIPLPSSSTGYVLALGNGTVIPIARGFTVSAPKTLAKVASAVGVGSASLTGMVRLTSPDSLSTVPSTAVVSDASGRYCVFVVEGKKLKAFVVNPAGGLPGVTKVTGLPKSIQSVVANPYQVAAGRSCR
jgi:hypothetical protein